MPATKKPSLRIRIRGFVLTGIAVFAMSLQAYATTYYVSPTGSNSNSGLSSSAAWKTLAHACAQVPAGDHTIRLLAGTFQETTNSYPKAGVEIVGNGRTGTSKTIVNAPTAWDHSADACTNTKTGYIVIIDNQDDVSVSGIEFVNDPAYKANGAIYCINSDNISVNNVAVLTFRYAGMFFYTSGNIEVQNCYLYNSGSSNICGASELGNITCRYISHSKFHHNEFRTDSPHGYGYRGRSQTNVKIYNNVFNIHSQFDIEIAHEHEYGVEIYNNDFRKAVSIPREVNQPNPNNNGYPYTIRIHHNRSAASYAIEGSRNHVEIDHNYFYGDGGGGRVYSDFGAASSGPVWIHHNVAENVSRGFIFKTGDDDNFFVYNNTIYTNTLYTGAIVEMYQSSGSSNFEFKNNVIVAPSTHPRSFIYTHGYTVPGLVIANNVVQNINGMPGGNFISNPGLALTGAKPFPYFYPNSATSYVVDKGVNVGFAYNGSAPDVGAYETLQSGAVYELKPKHVLDAGLNLNLDVYQSGGSTSQAQIWSDASSPNQRWKIESVGSGYYKLVPQHNTSLALDVNASGSANGTKIQVYTQNGSNAQQWLIEDKDDGYFRLSPRCALGSSLDVSGAGTTNGSKVHLWQSHNNPNQRWKIEKQ